MNTPNITKEQATWLIEVYAPTRNHSYIGGEYLLRHKQAMEIFKGKPVEYPSCKCEYGSFAQIANSYYEQFEQQIKDIYER